MKRRILVCNDDGVHGPGLPPLVAAMRRLGAVTVVVPDQERSADSHSLTLHKPIRIHRAGPDFYTLNGSPADCARLGILEIMKDKVDLVVSGINKGFNMGEDVIYSGTVAAAREASLTGKLAIAFSQDPASQSWAASSDWALKIARQVLRHGLAPGTLINVNFPKARAGRIKPPLPCRLGQRVYSKDIAKRSDPRGGHYYWLAGQRVTSVKSKGTDVAAVALGHASLTPLHIDSTDFAMLDGLRSWEL